MRGLCLIGAAPLVEFPELSWNPSQSFFREESRLSRDIAVLVADATLENEEALILDACAGAGSRALRYARDLRSAGRVVANEPNKQSGLAANAEAYGVEVRHDDAHKFLSDFSGTAGVVDCDSFGLSLDVSAAVRAAADGGIVFLTTTGPAAAGATNKKAALARLGARSGKIPGTQNELGLRMLMGRAASAAAADGASLTPLCSLYAPHGPVFRVAARVDRKRSRNSADFHTVYRFMQFCGSCGTVEALDWDDLGKVRCSSCGDRDSLKVYGPLWTGPLQDLATIQRAKDDASERGWDDVIPTLDLMIAEVQDSRLESVPIARSLDYVASLAQVSTPSKATFIQALHDQGYAAAPTHIDGKAVKTNAGLEVCVNIAKTLLADSSSRREGKES